MCTGEGGRLWRAVGGVLRGEELTGPLRERLGEFKERKLLEQEGSFYRERVESHP